MLLFVAGCVGEQFMLKPEGDEATITLKQGQVFEGRLLAINTEERALYTELTSGGEKIGVNEGEKIVGLPLDSLQSVTIQHYVNKSWVFPWVFSQVIPPILLGIAASREGASGGGVFLVSLIPAFASGLILVFSEPDPPQIQSEFSSDKIENLNLYTRFPLGLNPDQLHRIASLHGQKAVRILWDAEGKSL